MRATSPTGARIRPVRDRAAAVLAAGALGIGLLHLPLFASGFDRIQGDEGDARSFVYMAEHVYRAIGGPADVLSPGMFYPVRGTLGYTSPAAAHVALFSGFRAGGLDMFSAMAGAVVLVDLLNYISGYVFLRRGLRLGIAASCAGAMLFAFSSPRFNHAGHVNLHAGFLLPPVAGAMVYLVREDRSVGARGAFFLIAAAGFGLGLQTFVSPYHGWFFGFWACLLVLLAAALPTTRGVLLDLVRRRAALVAGVGGFVVGLLPALPLHRPVAREVGLRSWGLVRPLIPEGWSLLHMGPENYVWGDVSSALSRLHPLPSSEHYIGFGAVASSVWLILTVWAIRAAARDARRASPAAPAGRIWLAAIVLATSLVYAIGMKYGPVSPWAAVYGLVPGASGLRAVARYVLVLGLPMAAVFGVLLQRGFDAVSRVGADGLRHALRAALVGVVAFGVFEQFGRTPSFSKSEQLERLGRLAAALPDGCAVFYVAAAPDRRPIKYEYQIDAMLVSVMRGVPTVNGYSGYEPTGWSLREVEAPDYERRVEEWIARHRVEGPVCRLEVGD